MVDFKNKIIYEVYLKSFHDSTGSGTGDIAGVIAKLPYLKSLGITTLWITPFYVSPMLDNGYDISDYYHVNPDMGTMADVEQLIKQAREHGLEIMLDFVLNHTSSDHIWFQKALAGDKKYQDYYFFSKTKKTSWIGRFGGSVWEYVPQLKKYYLHLYHKSQPDLNWDNPAVRQEMIKIVDFWLSKGVAAYKFDVLYLISKPTSTNWKPDGALPVANVVGDGLNVHKYIRQIMKAIKDKYPNTYAVGEMSFSSIEKCIAYSLPTNQEVDLVQTGKISEGLPPGTTDSILRTATVDLKIYIANLKKWFSAMQSGGGWLCTFTANHDSSRTVNRFGDLKFWAPSAKIHIMNVAFLNGTPFYLQGQEIGMINPEYSDPRDYVDIKSQQAYQEHHGKIADHELAALFDRNGRDAGRNPMAWDQSNNGGWTSSSSPWRKTNQKHLAKINTASQETDQNSILNFFRKVMKMRQDYDAFKYGEINFINNVDPYILAYTREVENQKLMVILNFSSTNKLFSWQDDIEILINNYPNLITSESQITLLPWQGIVIKI